MIGAMEVRGESFEDVLEWQIGRLHLRGLQIVHNGAPFSLADEGWELRGFVGSCKIVPAPPLSISLGFGRHGLLVACAALCVCALIPAPRVSQLRRD